MPWTPGPGPTGGADTFTGVGTDADTVDGLGGDDVLNTGGGNDIATVTSGVDLATTATDTANLGAGDVDTLRLRYATLNGSSNVQMVESGSSLIDLAGQVTIGFSMRLSFSGVEIFDIEGGAAGDILFGGGGFDILEGNAGNDIVRGNNAFAAGGDILRGGGGNDDLAANWSDLAADQGVTLNNGGAGGGTAVVANNPDGRVLSGFEALTFSTGAGSDAITLSPLTFNNVNTGLGADRIVVIGGTSAAITKTNTLFFGQQSDGSGDVMVIRYGTLDANSPVLMTNEFGLTTNGFGNAKISGNTRLNWGGVEIFDVQTGAGNDDIFGLNGADTLFAGPGDDIVRGGGGNDSLDGGAGNDTVLGGAGNDSLRGGAGADAYDGGDGIDVVSFATATGINLFLDGSGTNARAAVGDTFVNVENVIGGIDGDFIVGDGAGNRFIGGTGNDTLWGRGGVDQLEGGAGADRLWGGAGNDILVGGVGNDVFVFADAPAAGGFDRTTDFALGDRIEIDASAFGGGLVAGGPVQLASGATPSSAGFVGGVFLYDTDSGYLSWDADGAGAGAAVLVFRLQTLPALTAGDFIVVA